MDHLCAADVREKSAEPPRVRGWQKRSSEELGSSATTPPTAATTTARHPPTTRHFATHATIQHMHVTYVCGCTHVCVYASRERSGTFEGLVEVEAASAVVDGPKGRVREGFMIREASEPMKAEACAGAAIKE